MSFMIEVLEISDLEELVGYRLLWNSWLANSPRATFINTWEWLDNYWRHFGRNQQLRVFIARSGGSPIGILPLCIRTESHHFGPLRVLTYPLDGWGSWYGPIGSNPAAAMLAVMQHIRRAPRDWDMIELPSTAPPSRDASRVGRSMRVVGLLSDQQAYRTTSLIDFSGGWNDYLASKSRKARHEMRRTLRRVFADGDVEYIRHRPRPAREGDGDPRWDLFAMCQQVALASWQATSTNGTTLTHERVRHFLRDAHAVAAHNGMVDVNLMLVDGRPAAFAYNYHFHGRLTGVRIGYDASLGRTEPGMPGWGTALMLASIEDSCQRSDVSLDLGPGETPFKRRLRTHTEASYRMVYTPLDSWRSQAVRLSRWARQRFQPSGADVGKAATA
jgi:CelD/BcsL family acetyltransferase involved in cellulose biosynthesis